MAEKEEATPGSTGTLLSHYLVGKRNVVKNKYRSVLSLDVGKLSELSLVYKVQITTMCPVKCSVV